MLMTIDQNLGKKMINWWKNWNKKMWLASGNPQFFYIEAFQKPKISKRKLDNFQHCLLLAQA